MDKDLIGELRKAAETILPWAVETRHSLHRHPELSFREWETTGFIAGELDRAGIPYTLLSERIPGATGIVARIQGKMEAECGNPGRSRTVALRADIDALPVTENSGVDFPSEHPGVMHACGHDLHVAILLAAGIVLKRLDSRFRGTVELIFQPAEEVGQGADMVIRSGLVSDADGMAAIHMDPAAPSGVFTVGYGSRTSSGYCAKIRVRADGNPCAEIPGKASANTGAAIREMAFLVNTIGSEFPKDCLRGNAVFTPTLLETGDDGAISATFDGRLTDERDRSVIREAVLRITKAAESIFGLPTESAWKTISGTVVNDRACTDLAAEVIRDVLGKDHVRFGQPVMFGEDFRRYREITDNQVFALLGGGGDFPCFSLHNSRVRFDDRAIRSGICYEAGFALEYLARGAYRKRGESWNRKK